MIKLTPMLPKYLEQVMTLSIADEQLAYVGTIEEVLVNADDKVHPHLVLADEQVVGIFLIDTIYSDRYDFAPSECLGFRAFLIDIKYQGLGYGKAVIAQLKSYLNHQYQQNDMVYLTVNCKNPVAYQCYLNNGFADLGELFNGGAAGPQHIMLMKIDTE
ncbi:acetyltransferase [Vibrio galatheae]|uniref:Acetyltransferase n=1 Tax=Vibrio galatheae TaxID=579748 RepID=A0A0F4NF59_9VIBR|nr:GNAT family N-acetyltransferase [Vibrio galatheae]KJY81752.1 acetyltransferase [Vibrio galatheae]